MMPRRMKAPLQFMYEFTVGASFSNFDSFQINIFDSQEQLKLNHNIEKNSLTSLNENQRSFKLTIPREIFQLGGFYNYEKKVTTVSLKEVGQRRIQLGQERVAQSCDEWNKQNFIVKLEQHELLAKVGLGLMEGKSQESFTNVRQIQLKAGTFYGGETYISQESRFLFLQFYFFEDFKQSIAEFEIKVQHLDCQSNNLVFQLNSENVSTLLSALQSQDQSQNDEIQNQLRQINEHLIFKKMYQYDIINDNLEKLKSLGLIVKGLEDEQTQNISQNIQPIMQILEQHANLQRNIENILELKEQTRQSNKANLIQIIDKILLQSHNLEPEIIKTLNQFNAFLLYYVTMKGEGKRYFQTGIENDSEKKQSQYQEFRKEEILQQNKRLKNKRLQNKVRIQIQQIENLQETKEEMQQKVKNLNQENRDFQEQIQYQEEQIKKQKKELQDFMETTNKLKSKIQSLKNEIMKTKESANQQKQLMLSEGYKNKQNLESLINELMSRIDFYQQQEINFLQTIESLFQKNGQLKCIIDDLQLKNKDLYQKLMKSEFDYSQLINFVQTLRPQTARAQERPIQPDNNRPTSSIKVNQPPLKLPRINLKKHVRQQFRRWNKNTQLPGNL